MLYFVLPCGIYSFHGSFCQFIGAISEGTKLSASTFQTGLVSGLAKAYFIMWTWQWNFRFSCRGICVSYNIYLKLLLMIDCRRSPKDRTCSSNWFWMIISETSNTNESSWDVVWWVQNLLLSRNWETVPSQFKRARNDILL